MTYRIENKKWILYRHTNNFEKIIGVAVNLKKISNCHISSEDKLNLLKKLKDLNYYKERNPEIPLDSINHMINTLSYFMFGYQKKINGKKMFLFSPLGNLFLKYIDDIEKRKLIFITMLWAIQFNHPHGGTDESFKLYPFRLIFKLLMDERIEGKLSVAEGASIIMFVKESTEEKYELIVRKILKLRE